jgi:hypothetical protein
LILKTEKSAISLSITGPLIMLIDFILDKDSEGHSIENNQINQDEMDKSRRSNEIYQKCIEHFGQKT